ncbi:type IV pilus biogenesis protein PilM [Pseudomonas lopnurensis]|uniref:type IV pilus biogenesis protein PilM n=1 Tax=Pseudomonas lopnurensis TaxID=1477517 RepID=UPI0028AD581C|nr:type IV pilus biogenesis protein PilM [Pseudomonas lopnurensis]
MYFNWIVLTLLVIVVGVISQVQHQESVTSEQADIDALSRGLLVYRSAAAEYARLNPAFTGTPDDTVLSLPAWFHKPSGLSTIVNAGLSYTFLSSQADGDIAGLPAALTERTDSSFAVGVNRSGSLVSPKFGQTDILLPAAIPEGAVVAVN